MIYVNYMHRIQKKNPRLLDAAPILGPHFVPPSPPTVAHHASSSRHPLTNFYLKSLTIVHPFYKLFIGNVEVCPGCRKRGCKSDVKWSEWASRGPRPVHGLHDMEYMLGYQMDCKVCKNQDGMEGMKSQSTWTTTNPDFWEGIAYWQVPGSYPDFEGYGCFD